ncbi:MAG: nucleotidyltransferase family protein [Pseudomonadota bacterium]
MNHLLNGTLLTPERAGEFNDRDLSILVRHARSCGLLAALCVRLKQTNQFEGLPIEAQRHLHSALVVADKQARDLKYELKWIKRALDSVNIKSVLLKGAAYILADLPSGRGRLISDIDLLIPKSKIEDAECALKEFGWHNGEYSAYDERYYRQWMHEIPPLGHPKRGSTIDVHHTILPPTAAPNVDANLLFANTVEIGDGLYGLAPIDMVIHSATHLFHEGEFHHGLRDLWDIDRMLRDFSARIPTFWRELAPRAEQLDLTDSLFHGLVYSNQVFSTPLPNHVVSQASNWSRKLKKPMMNFLFKRAFSPDQPETRWPLTDTALNALYVRSHYLRMPLRLLMPHLLRKAWTRRFQDKQTSEGITNAAEA